MDREQWAQSLDRVDSFLGSLLGAHFNEDWDLDHGEDWRNVVAAFAQQVGASNTSRTVAELEELIHDGLSDADLGWLLLDGVHAYVYLDRFGYPTWRAWLEAVRDQLRRL